MSPIFCFCRQGPVVRFAAVLLVIALSQHRARASAILSNPSFESGLTSWTTAGTVLVSGPDLTAASNGTFQAIIDKSNGVSTLTTMVTFLGVTQTQLASVIGDGDLSDLSDSVSSAVKQTFSVAADSSLRFDYNPFTLQTPDVNLAIYPETIVAVLDGTAYFVNDTDHANFTHSNGFRKWSDYATFTGLPNLAAGSHTIAVAAIGSTPESGLELDNFVLGVVAVPAPNSLYASLLLLPLAYFSRRRMMSK
jgi:hypothetical protein